MTKYISRSRWKNLKGDWTTRNASKSEWKVDEEILQTMEDAERKLIELWDTMSVFGKEAFDHSATDFRMKMLKAVNGNTGFACISIADKEHPGSGDHHEYELWRLEAPLVFRVTSGPNDRPKIEETWVRRGSVAEGNQLRAIWAALDDQQDLPVWKQQVMHAIKERGLWSTLEGGTYFEIAPASWFYDPDKHVEVIRGEVHPETEEFDVDKWLSARIHEQQRQDLRESLPLKIQALQVLNLIDLKEAALLMNDVEAMHKAIEGEM